MVKGALVQPTGSYNKRNVGLDCARAAAIGLVLLCHWGEAASRWFGFYWPPIVGVMSGFLGVELFFALSGFLVGSLLLELIERDPSLLSWWRFMVRRWLRTLPLYFFCVGTLALLWPPNGNRNTYLLSYSTFTQNLLWPMPQDNWFNVSWSLSIEEWFYLLFSALLVGGVALTGRRACAWGVIALFIAAPTLLRWQMIASAGQNPSHIREIVALRLDAITYGVVVAKFWHDRNPIVARPGWLAVVGIALLVEQWFQPIRLGRVPPTLFLILFFSASPIAFSLCLPAAMGIRRIPNGLEFVVRRLSALSYPLYLVHFTLLEAIEAGQVRFGVSGAGCAAISVGLIFGVSYALHRWVEAPIMARRPRQFGDREPGKFELGSRAPSGAILPAISQSARSELR
jgi:peptidoglycan/LPS O-acetylase OafA/YrhL